MKIAVFLRESREILPFYSFGVVEIYSDEGGYWECINEIPFDMERQYDLPDTQKRISLLTLEFEDCNLLVVDNIKGLPKALLQEKGIGIWKFSGIFLPELLDFVSKELKKTLRAQAQVKKVVRPILVGDKRDAEYEINLAQELKNDRSSNSLDILIPFIKETNFKKLNITCEHLPKWFDRAMESFELKSFVDQDKEGLLYVIVSPIQFGQDISSRMQIYIPGMGGGCSSGGS